MTMKRLFKFLIPPPGWQRPVIVLTGIFSGLGVYVFIISNAASYLSDKPETCVNCHVMNPEYATWKHSSHREVATCNDCHVPHDNFVHKYVFKAQDGLRHATMFTLRAEPQVIRIKDAGLKVVQENCKRCHENLNKNVATIKVTGDNYLHGQGRLCWECHRETPHGKVKGLSATPYARVPKLEDPIPDWINKLTEK
jgi:cytochrome c nitrite reductase small subunit